MCRLAPIGLASKAILWQSHPLLVVAELLNKFQLTWELVCAYAAAPERQSTGQ